MAPGPAEERDPAPWTSIGNLRARVGISWVRGQEARHDPMLSHHVDPSNACCSASAGLGGSVGKVDGSSETDIGAGLLQLPLNTFEPVASYLVAML